MRNPAAVARARRAHPNARNHLGPPKHAKGEDGDAYLTAFDELLAELVSSNIIED